MAVAVPMLTVMVPTASAVDVVAQADGAKQASPELLASWDFTGDYMSENGTIADSTGTYNMTLHNGAYIEKFGDRNQNEALQLKGDSQQYAEIDDQLFEDAGDSFTLEFSAKSRHADDGNYFSFAVGKDSTHYMFTYLSTTTVKAVISDNAWNNEQGSEVSVSDNDNIWHDYKLVVDGTTLALYRDDALVVFKANTGIKMSDLGGYITYIGRSFYTADTYWNGAIDDIKVYKGADLTVPTSVTISGDGVVDGELMLTESESTQLTATVEPEDAVDTSVTWSSSDDDVVTVSEDGVATAKSAGDAIITATTELGSVKAELKVTVEQLDTQSAVQADLDSAISALKTTTTENLPLIAQGTKHESDIVWESSDPTVITGTDADYEAPAVGAADPYKGAGVVTRPAYGEGDVTVTLTATASKDGTTITSEPVKITVKEHTRTVPDEAYASVTFLSDDATTNGKIGEALYESATDGNDFFSFSEINNTDPVIVSDADTKGLRDPYVLKSHDGDKYYMIATDLKVSDQGWSENQQYGSLKIEAWESTDMVNWTRTNAEDGDTGITINSANAGMTWAPEAVWDDSLNAYVVFFSTREYTDDTRSEAVVSDKTGSAYNEVWYVITRDFKTYTCPPVQWQDTGYSRIDSTVFKIGDYYYRLTKNEESGAAGDYITTGKSTFLERSKVLTAPTSEASPDNDPETSWQLLDQNILPFEGPESIKLNDGDVNQNEAGDAMVIMADSGGYQPYMTSESALAACDWNNRLSQTDGWNTQKASGPGVSGYVYDDGMPTPTRHGAFVNVPAAVAENMHRWTTENPTTVDPTDSTTVLTRDGNTLTAAVTAADGGNLAGTVTFTAGEWSKAVKLNAGGVATAELPDDVNADTIKASYDGYTDGLVNPSSGAITVNSYDRADSATMTVTADATLDEVKASAPTTVKAYADGASFDAAVKWDWTGLTAEDIASVGTVSVNGVVDNINGGDSIDVALSITVNPYNVNLDENVKAEASYTENGYSPDATRDGSISTLWSDWASGGAGVDPWLSYTFGEAKQLTELRFVSASSETNVSSLAIDYLDVEGNWVDSGISTNQVNLNGGTTTVDLSSLPATSGVRVRMAYNDSNTYTKVAEVEIYGAAPKSAEPEPETPATDEERKPLESALTAADALQEEDYTADTWAAFVQAREEARKVLDDASATKSDVDAALASLLAAQDALDAVEPTDPTDPTDPSDPTDPTDPDTNPTNPTQSDDGSLSNTGSTIIGVVVAVLVLAAAGVALTVWRKNRS